jgi:hypothetical protein
MFNPPNERHAWIAIEDSLVVVMTRGPRGGKEYESDTFRLAEAEKLTNLDSATSMKHPRNA